MSFKGDLRNISLFDVLQTLNQNQQTGVLVVQQGALTRKIHVSPQGVRVFFTRASRPLRLGEIFVRRGVLTPQDVEILLMQQKNSYRPIGELLVESGKVRQEDVDHILAYRAEDEIYESFSWESGSFAFHDGQSPDDEGKEPLSATLLDPSSLCLEAARRLDEMQRLREVIWSTEEPYRQTEGVLLPEDHFDAYVVAVFEALAEVNSVDDLRDLVGLSLFDTLRAVAPLSEAEVIRFLTLEELLDEARNSRESGDFERAVRMFERAYLREQDNRGIIEECIECLERLNQPKKLSNYLAILGRLALAAGNQEEALELLEQSLRQDSDNYEILVALRDGYAHIGDVDRAAEMSHKIARTNAEEGDLEGAMRSCREGLEIAPGSVPLHYYLCQLLVRANLPEQAHTELNSLIQETLASKEAMRSKKVHELLSSCFRLLLKIDPQDEHAHRGLRDLDKRRMSDVRRRKFVLRGAVAAACLLLVAGIGLTLRNKGPSALLQKVQAAHENHDLAEVRLLIDTMLEKHPDAEETQAGLRIRNEMQQYARSRDVVRKKREDKLRHEFDTDLEEVKSALQERPYLEALALVKPLLERLNKAETAFLRARVRTEIEYELGNFLDRVTNRFKDEVQQVALTDHQMRKSEKSAKGLKELENRLSGVRARDWPRLVPQMLEILGEIENAPQAGKTRQAIGHFRRQIRDGESSFGNLDKIYFTVRRNRLHVEINDAVALAQQQGRELLLRCEFERARELYETAFAKADAVTDEEPRKIFLPLINWLEKSGTRDRMQRRRDEIDVVTKTLAEIEVLREAGDAAGAYLLFRPLVSNHLYIQFERKYRMPYLVSSTPKGADVYLNGERVGRTPVTVELDIIKRADVTVRRKGFADTSTRIVPTDPSLTGELDLELTKETAWEREISGAVEATPVIAGSQLFVTTSRASLMALDIENGRISWEARTQLLDRITAAPVVTDTHVYFVTNSGLLHRVLLKTGKFDGPVLKLSGGVGHDCAYDGKTLYLVTRNRRLLAVRGTEIVYDKPLSLGPTTRVLHAQGSLYLGTAEGEILVHDAKTGDEVRRLKARSATSFLAGIVEHKGLVLCGAEDGRLYAFDMKTGAAAWQYQTAGPLTAPPVSDGDLVYAPARDGFVHAVDAKGRRAIRYELSGASESRPAVTNGFLYAVGGNRVAAFDTADELPWWDYSFARTEDSPRYVVLGKGVILVVTNASRIVAFPRDER